MTESAQSQAFSIPEIFELILLKLDNRTLLTTAQLICRTWTTFIQESAAIQWALCFKSVTNPHLPTWQNPLLAEAFPSIFSSSTPEVKSNIRFTYDTFDMFRHPEKFEAYMRPEASWRYMLVQQPPLTTLSLLRSSAGHGGQFFYRYETLVRSTFVIDHLSYPILTRTIRIANYSKHSASAWKQYSKPSSSARCQNSTIISKQRR